MEDNKKPGVVVGTPDVAAGAREVSVAPDGTNKEQLANFDKTC